MNYLSKRRCVGTSSQKRPLLGDHILYVATKTLDFAWLLTEQLTIALRVLHIHKNNASQTGF